MARNTHIAELNLVGFMFILVIGLPRFLDQGNHAAHARLAKEANAVESQLVDDPSIGSVLILPLQHAMGSQGSIVLITDNCASCALARIHSLATVQLNRNIRRVIVAPSKVLGELTALLGGDADSLTLVDSENVALEEYNCAFMPRLYALDEHDALVYIQSPYTTTSYALSEAVRRIEGDRNGQG